MSLWNQLLGVVVKGVAVVVVVRMEYGFLGLADSWNQLPLPNQDDLESTIQLYMVEKNPVEHLHF